MDTTAIGQAAAIMMEKVAEEFGEDAEIEAALIVADVTSTDDDGDEATFVRWCARNGDGKMLSAAHSAGLAAIAEDQIVTPSE